MNTIRLILLTTLFIHVNLKAQTRSNAERHSALLTGHLSFLKDGDSIKVISSDFAMFSAISFTRYVTAKNQEFSILIDSIEKLTNINIQFPSHIQQYSLTNLLIEAGDSIAISESSSCSYDDNRCLIFGGTNFEKLNFQKDLHDLQSELYQARWQGPSDFIPSKENFIYIDSMCDSQLQLLKGRREFLTNNAFMFYKINILSGAERMKDYSLNHNLYELDTRKYIPLLQGYQDPLSSQLLDEQTLSCGIAEHSLLYADCLIYRYRTDSCFLENKDFNLPKCYNYFKNQFTGKLKEKIITYLLYENRFKSQNLTSCIKDALVYINNPEYRNALVSLMESNTEGAAAFNFSLKDTHDKTRHLTDFAEKTVIIDFWFTGCGNCQVLYPKLKKVEQHFRNNRNVVFISVSIDGEKEQWIKSVNKEIYTSKNAINLYTNGQKDKHPIIKHYNIEAYPTLLIINKKGRLLPSPIDPRYDEGKNLISIINMDTSAN